MPTEETIPFKTFPLHFYQHFKQSIHYLQQLYALKETNAEL